MNKAEEIAKQLYPDWGITLNPKLDGQEQSNVRIQRQAFLKGYYQAEKKLELTWDDVEKIYCLTLNLREYLGSSVFGEPLYQEVLKRFNETRNKRQ